MKNQVSRMVQLKAARHVDLFPVQIFSTNKKNNIIMAKAFVCIHQKENISD